MGYNNGVSKCLITDVSSILKTLTTDHRLDHDEYEYLLQTATIATLDRTFREHQGVYYQGVYVWGQQYYSLFEDDSDWLYEIREDIIEEFGHALKSHIDFIKYHTPYFNSINFHDIRLRRNKLILEFTLF